MSAIISILFYIILLFGVSSLLFTLLLSRWNTNEPVIAYLLSLIITHLVLDTLGQIGKGDK
jgi:hypothetical protein